MTRRATSDRRSGGVPGLGEPVRERHREAGGVRRGDQLLRARPPVRSSAREAQVTSSGAERAAADARRSSPRRRHQIALPRHLCASARSPSLPPSRVVRRSRPRRSPGSAPRTGSPRRRSATAARKRGLVGVRARDACTASCESTIRCPSPSTSSMTIVARTVEPPGRRPPARQLGRERHRVAGGVRRGEQLLGARLLGGLADRARLRVRQPGERAARRGRDRAAAARRAALPGDLGVAASIRGIG